MTRREFVLYPLYEIAPDLVLPDGTLLKGYLDEVSGVSLQLIKH
jgi:2-amino-4-hydroxy-6-hydroxymethyldihydropteridine diphosphokinase